MPPGAFFFFAGHVVRRCNLSHETFRNTRSKKKTRPCDFLVRTDAPKTPLGTYVQNFEDTPGAGIMTPQKQREGRHLRPEVRRRSTRQRHDSPETTRRSPFTPRISRTHHTPASRQAENNETVTTYALNFEDAASRRAENNEKVATSSQNFEALRSTRSKKKKKNSRRCFFCSARCTAM